MDIQASPRTLASATSTNIVDTAITTVSAATPGVELDFENRGRVAAAGAVPVVMKVRAKMSGVDVGHVVMKDSAGTELISVEIDTTSEAWYSETALIPSAIGKYDFQFSASAGTITLYALSLYQYQA